MATTFGPALANALATPAVPNGKTAVRLISVAETVSVPVLALNDLVIFGTKIPVESKIHSIRIASTDLGTTGTLSYGFYKIVDGAAVLVSGAAAIAANLDVKTAAVALTDRRTSVLSHTTMDSPAFTLAGLSARPAYEHLYIGAKATEATDATGSLTLVVEHTV